VLVPLMFMVLAIKTSKFVTKYETIKIEYSYAGVERRERIIK